MSEMRDVLRREIKVLAFDQYGTIVDMQKGLTEAVTPFLKQKGWDGKPNNFVTWWRRTHFENSMIDALCDRGHTPYRQIGHRAVSYVMDRSGIAYTQKEASWLVREIEKLKPFPDVVAALKELRSRGYKLTILSNGDRDMLKAAGPYTRTKTPSTPITSLRFNPGRCSPVVAAREEKSLRGDLLLCSTEGAFSAPGRASIRDSRLSALCCSTITNLRRNMTPRLCGVNFAVGSRHSAFASSSSR
jgi:hypothetical protein